MIRRAFVAGCLVGGIVLWSSQGASSYWAIPAAIGTFVAIMWIGQRLEASYADED